LSSNAFPFYAKLVFSNFWGKKEVQFNFPNFTELPLLLLLFRIQKYGSLLCGLSHTEGRFCSLSHLVQIFSFAISGLSLPLLAVCPLQEALAKKIILQVVCEPPQARDCSAGSLLM
jgi:hypothetical protein